MAHERYASRRRDDDAVGPGADRTFATAKRTWMNRGSHAPRWSARSPPASAFNQRLMLTFAVKQTRVGELERLSIEVSTPGSTHHRRFLSYDEAHAFTANPVAAARILGWLCGPMVGATVSNVHSHGHYIQAEATVAQWEHALTTHFAAVSSAQGSESPHVLVADEDLLVPASVAADLEGIFGATQLPLALMLPAAGRSARHPVEFSPAATAETGPDGRQLTESLSPSPPLVAFHLLQPRWLHAGTMRRGTLHDAAHSAQTPARTLMTEFVRMALPDRMVCIATIALTAPTAALATPTANLQGWLQGWLQATCLVMHYKAATRL